MYVLTQSPPRRISKRISTYQPANIRDRLTVLYPSIIIAKMFVCICIENSIVHVVDKKEFRGIRHNIWWPLSCDTLLSNQTFLVMRMSCIRNHLRLSHLCKLLAKLSTYWLNFCCWRWGRMIVLVLMTYDFYEGE